MKTKWQPIVVSVCGLLMVSPACGRGSSGEPEAIRGNQQTVIQSQDQKNARACEILHRFLSSSKLPQNMKRILAPERLGAMLVWSQPSGFNVHDGLVMSARLDESDVTVSLDNQAVIFFFSESAAPTGYVKRLRRQDKIQIAPEGQGHSPSRISIDEARDICGHFLLQQLGDENLKKLEISVRAEAFTSPRGFYLFAGESTFDSTHVRWGIFSVSVAVNASTGVIFEYHRHGSPLEGNPIILPNRAKEIANMFFEAAGMTAEVESLTYLEARLRSGYVMPIWAIRYREIILGPIHSISNLFINANTGEVIPDPSWLNRPEMAFSLQEKRSFIKEITQKMQGDTDQSSAAAN